MASRLTHRLATIACTALLTTHVAQRTMAQTGPAKLAVSLPAMEPSSEIPQPLTLSRALGIARRGHPDLRVAVANLATLRADSTFAGVRSFNPVVELQGTRGGQSIGSGSEDLGISQELELGGKRAARQAAATARSRAGDRKSTRLNSSHERLSRMPSSA